MIDMQFVCLKLYIFFKFSVFLGSTKITQVFEDELLSDIHIFDRGINSSCTIFNEHKNIEIASCEEIPRIL